MGILLYEGVRPLNNTHNLSYPLSFNNVSLLLILLCNMTDLPLGVTQIMFIIRGVTIILTSKEKLLNFFIIT